MPAHPAQVKVITCVCNGFNFCERVVSWDGKNTLARVRILSVLLVAGSYLCQHAPAEAGQRREDLLQERACRMYVVGGYQSCQSVVHACIHSVSNSGTNKQAAHLRVGR